MQFMQALEQEATLHVTCRMPRPDLLVTLKTKDRVITLPVWEIVTVRMRLLGLSNWTLLLHTHRWGFSG